MNGLIICGYFGNGLSRISCCEQEIFPSESCMCQFSVLETQKDVWWSLFFRSRNSKKHETELIKKNKFIVSYVNIKS